MITDVAQATKLIHSKGRDAFVAKARIRTQVIIKPESGYGGTCFGAHGESWPTHQGRPLIPWLQIATDGFPSKHPELSKFGYMAFFLDPKRADDCIAAFDEEVFVVRTYKDSKKLVPLIRPSLGSEHPFHGIDWELQKDVPPAHHFTKDIASDTIDTLRDHDEQLEIANLSGVKIGGWPTPFQRPYDLLATDDYRLQIDITENYMFADSGIGYIYHDADRGWIVSFESC